MSQELILIAGLAAGLLSAGVGAEIHVAPGGDDANPGRAGKPVATLARARDAARAQGGRNSIVLAPGRYFITAPVVLDERDSGLTIRGGKPGAVAEVYGGVPVNGWEQWRDCIWRAAVPKGKRFYNLIVDGKPATMAQTPDAGSGFGGGALRRGNEAVVVPPEWRGYDFSDAQVFAFLGANWFSELREVLTPVPDAQGQLQVDEITAVWFEAYQRIYDIIRLDDGSSTFGAFRLWGPGRTAKLQCDASAMFSPAMFRRFVAPSLTKQCEWLDHSLYHLDGTQALVQPDTLP